MKIVYCKDCSPKVCVAANDVTDVVSHNVYDSDGVLTATHTDFGVLDKPSEPFTTDLSSLDTTYSADYV